MPFREDDLTRRLVAVERRLDSLSRAPTGNWSIPVSQIRWATSAGVPTDAAFADVDPIPVGVPVYDTVNRRWYVRNAPNDWDYTALT